MSARILIFLLCAMLPVAGFSQFDTEIQDSSDIKILYKHELSGGLNFHSLGFGANFRSGQRLTVNKTRFWELEFVGMKSYKQVKVVNVLAYNSRRFVYGKMNDAFFLRAGMGWKKLLNRKPFWGGVEVRLTYGGGFSLGLEKPYYLYVVRFIDNSNNISDYVIETQQYDPNYLSYDLIYGRAPFTNGLGEIKPRPGFYGRLALNFDYGSEHTMIKSLEAGVVMDVMPLGLTIMISEADQIIFPTLYVTISLGKRFNKY